MSVTRRGLLGLVLGLPMALRQVRIEPLSALQGARRERLFRGQWTGVTYEGVPLLWAWRIDDTDAELSAPYSIPTFANF